MLIIEMTAKSTATEAARFNVLAPGVPARIALAFDAPLQEVIKLLAAKGFGMVEVAAALREAAEYGKAVLGEVELPHPDDVLVVSKHSEVNHFCEAYEAALGAPEWVREEAEAEAARWEAAAKRVAPEAVERVCMSAEVRRERWARELRHPDAAWL